MPNFQLPTSIIFAFCPLSFAFFVLFSPREEMLMKGFEKERKKRTTQIWGKPYFFTLIIASTLILLLILTLLNDHQFKIENIISGCISLINAILAYLVTKKDQGKRTYKKMMNDIKTWTIARFIIMGLAIILPIVLNLLDALTFVFSFIGFYIMHQIIMILVLQKEANS